MRLVIICFLCSLIVGCSGYEWNDKADRCIDKKTGKFVKTEMCK